MLGRLEKYVLLYTAGATLLVLLMAYQSSVGNWSPALQIRTILLSIQALLGAPNPDDPLANDVAERWKSDEPAAIQTAREWTARFAKSS